jgi:hypothetical protein
MEHTTAIDIAALEAEIAAIEAEDAEQSARVNALLGVLRLADCRVMAEQASRELAVQERYQRRISRAIEAP